MRDTCVVESFLEVRILHLLRIAELLHEEYKPLSAALLNHVSYELATAVLGRLRIIKKDIVIHVCKLFCKSSKSILLVLRNVCTEGTALMSNIISCDRDVVVLEDFKKLRVVYDDTGCNNLCSLPVTYRKSCKLFIQLFKFRCVFRFLHEEECL